MCLLTFLPAGIQPDVTALRHGAEANDDGHGFAIVSGRQLIVERGMDADQMIHAFATARRQHPAGPALFHSRYSTHGGTDIGNCHPFPVAGDRRTVIAHNGVLPVEVHPAPGDPRSDTRIAAEDLLGTLGSLRVRRTRLLLQRWMTPANKMVILTVDRRFTRPAYILNEESGIWADGIWYSNTGYLPFCPDPSWSRWRADASGDGRHWWDAIDAADAHDRCPMCRGLIPVTDTECWHCGWCLDCHQELADCDCYTPGAPPARAPRGLTSSARHWTDATT